MNVNHIAIIPDGNRRWAKQRGLPSLEGHRRGFEAATEISKRIRELGISTTTIWAFSTENWKRTQEEVSYLMDIYCMLIDRDLKEAIENEVKITHLGSKDRIPQKLLKQIQNAEEQTREFKKFYLNIAIDYGGRDELIRAIQKVKDPTLLTSETFEDYLDTKDQPYPNPDLIIRTSGEMRTSGFLPWQGVYAEYIFLEKYFPDMAPNDIDKAVEEYESRQRRFGK